jgi:hypothetical protein
MKAICRYGTYTEYEVPGLRVLALICVFFNIVNFKKTEMYENVQKTVKNEQNPALHVRYLISYLEKQGLQDWGAVVKEEKW